MTTRPASISAGYGARLAAAEIEPDGGQAEIVASLATLEQELANRLAHTEDAKRKEKIREVACEIGEFVLEYKCRSGKS